MAKFGNTGASGLLRTASSSAAKINSYNDAMQAAQWDASAKDQAAHDAYQSYLGGRVASTQNLDPTKALTLSNTMRTATRAFNSAEIGRVSTSVKYGDMSLDDKYNQLAGLREKAIANGDYNQAQSLEGQMASTDVARKNEAIAAQNKAEANAAKAASATNQGYTHAVSQIEDGVKQLNAAKLAGQITPAVYNDRMSQLYMGNAKTGTPGLIDVVQKAREATGDPNGTWQSKLDGYAADHTVQSLVNGNKQANLATGNNFTQTIVKNTDGTYGFHDRPSSELATDANGHQVANKLLTDANGNPVKDASDHAITIPQYAGATASTDKSGAVNGFQYATNIDSKTGMPSPGTGATALRQINSNEINHDDPSGVPYFFNEAGQKKFIGKDPANGKPIMGNDPSVVTGKVDGGGPSLVNPIDFYTHPQNLKDLADTAGKLGSATGSVLSSAKGVPVVGSLLGSAGGLISRLFNRSNAAAEARQQAINLDNANKAAQARQASDALALHNQAMTQAKLLPVFRAPAPAPAPAPKNQYQLPALPAPVKLPGGSGISVPSSTGNAQKDVLNLGRSLGGLM